MHSFPTGWAYAILIVGIAAVLVLPPSAAFAQGSRGTSSVSVPSVSAAIEDQPAIGSPADPAMVGAGQVLGLIPVGYEPSDVEVDSATDTGYVTNEFSNNVSVIDGATNAVIASVPVGTSPVGVAGDSATNTVYVANLGSGNVSVIDGATNALTATVAVGNAPAAVAVDSASDTIYVANMYSNDLSVIDGATNTVTTTIPVGSSPQSVGVDGATDTIYAVNTISNSVSVIDGVTNAVTATVAVGAAPEDVGVDSATDTIYVVNSESWDVSVIDGATHAVTATVAVGEYPEAVGVDIATDTIYVANSVSDNVSVIDGATHTVIASLQFQGYAYPDAVGVDSATDSIYVADGETNNVSVIDGATNTVTATVGVGTNPVGVGVDAATDNIYVATEGLVSICVIDGATNTISTIELSSFFPPDPVGVGVDGATDTVYVADWDSNNVSVIAGATHTLTATIPVELEPSMVAVDSATDTIYAADGGSNNVSVIDGATDTVSATIPVGSNPQGVAVDSTTDTIYVVNQGSNNVSVIDGATNTVTNTIPVGSVPAKVAVDNATDTVYVTNSWSNDVSVIDGATNTVTASIPVGSHPEGVAADSATDTVYVVNEYSNNLSVIDGGTNAVTATLRLGAYPEGVDVDSATDTLYVTNSGADDVSVIHVGTVLWVPPPTVSRSSIDHGQATAVQFSDTGLGGGTLPYSYTWSGLPAGCASAASTFTCSPASAAPGLYSVTLTVTDASEPSQSRSSGPVTFTILPDPAVSSAPVAAPGSVDLGQPVTFHATVANPGSGTDVYSWSGLPPGCPSANSLVVSCTPTAADSYAITIHVNDSNGENVSSPLLAFSVLTDPQVSAVVPSRVSADVGQTVLFSTTASGGTRAYGAYAWTYPSGLGCAPSTSNVLTCVPTEPVSAGPVSVNVTDTNDRTSASASLPYTVASDPTITTPTATKVSLDVGGSTTLSFVATNGTGLPSAYSWSGLPGGCHSENAVSISCSPTAVGTFAVSASIQDSNGFKVSSSATVLVVSPTLGQPTLSVSRSSLDVGQSVDFTVSVNGGTGPLTYVWTGLPAGCRSVDAPTLACAPNATGSFTVKVTVSDGAGASSSAPAVPVTVAAAPSTTQAASSVNGLEWGLTGAVAVLAAGVVGMAYLFARGARKQKGSGGSGK